MIQSPYNFTGGRLYWNHQKDRRITTLCLPHREEENMKHLKVLVNGMIKNSREKRLQRRDETVGYTDNYTMLGSILGGYCSTLSSGNRRDRRD